MLYICNIFDHLVLVRNIAESNYVSNTLPDVSVMVLRVSLGDHVSSPSPLTCATLGMMWNHQETARSMVGFRSGRVSDAPPSHDQLTGVSTLFTAARAWVAESLPVRHTQASVVSEWGPAVPAVRPLDLPTHNPRPPTAGTMLPVPRLSPRSGLSAGVGRPPCRSSRQVVSRLARTM